MWIAGLNVLRKPFVHLHTQFNRDIPWATIDMDFMNLNQSAHGDREFGFIGTRLRRERKVVVGHWQDAEVQAELETLDARRGRLARLAGREDRPLRRQHARGGRHRRRQGRGADPLRLLGQRLRRRRPGRLRECGERRRGRPACRRVRRAVYGGRIAAQRRQPARGAARGGPHRAGHARFPDRRRLQGLHHHLRGSARAGAAARPGGAAADGRRLRLRRGRATGRRRRWCAR